MKYKVGDKVKIKSLDWYNENKIDYGTSYGANKIKSYVKCNGCNFLDIMSPYCGKELTVDIAEEDNNISTYIMKEPAISFKFTEDMIEGLVDEPQEKMVSLEDVCNFLNDHLYTGTSTGDYDYGQEYICSDFDNASDLIFALRKAMEE